MTGTMDTSTSSAAADVRASGEVSLPPELACPRCRGELAPVGGSGVQCRACGRTYRADHDALDLLPDDVDEDRGLAQSFMHRRPVARIYEGLWRPTFVAVATAGAGMSGELERIQAWLGPARGGTVADLSCGSGHVARYLAGSGSYGRVFAVDRSSAMLAECARRCRAEGIDDELVRLRGDVGALPFDDGTLSGLHAGAAMHLWPEPERALAEIGRVLRPGGVLVASTFLRLGRGDPRRAGQRLVERLLSMRFFEPDELRRLADRAELGDLELITSSSFVLFRVIRRGGAG